MAQEAAAADCLQRYQAIVAMASELDLSVLHPPMADRTPQPLCAMSQWDHDRLRRISRWRPAEDSGKDLVRAYAKVILALDELDSCAQHVSMHARASATVTPTVAAEPLNLPTPPPTAAAVVLKSAVKRQPPVRGKLWTAVGVARQLAPRGKVPSLRLAPPPCLYEIWAAWSIALQCVSTILMLALTWAPLIIVTTCGLLVLTEPTLFVRLCWQVLGFVPSALRAYLRTLVEPTTPVPIPQPQFASAVPLASFPSPPSQPEPASPALMLHCSVEPSFFDMSAVWLLAGEGGALAALAVYIRMAGGR